MSTLYTVTYTELRSVTRFDGKGNKIGEITTEIPITLRQMPALTAAGYKDMAGFSMTPEVRDWSQEQRSTYRKPKHEAPAEPVMRKSAPKRSTAPAVSSTAEAAKTGDMSAAINGGR